MERERLWNGNDYGRGTIMERERLWNGNGYGTGTVKYQKRLRNRNGAERNNNCIFLDIVLSYLTI